jgi:hypothetical protein
MGVGVFDPVRHKPADQMPAVFPCPDEPPRRYDAYSVVQRRRPGRRVQLIASICLELPICSFFLIRPGKTFLGPKIPMVGQMDWVERMAWIKG